VSAGSCSPSRLACWAFSRTVAFIEVLGEAAALATAVAAIEAIVSARVPEAAPEFIIRPVAVAPDEPPLTAEPTTALGVAIVGECRLVNVGSGGGGGGL
jgi:hypothetical protein